MRTYKQLMEMNRGHIASFEQPDDPEFELQVYKMKNKYYIDAW